MFEKIKRYYQIGIYKDKHIKRLFELGKITKEEYEEIMESNVYERNN